MSDEEALDALPDPEASLRVRLSSTRDQLVHEAATRLIHLGRELPQLKQAGYWLYGAMTHVTQMVPRGKTIDMLGSVGDTVYRGAQPSYRGFHTLKELGVDTVINLRPESDHERKIVAKQGMRYLYMPLPPLDAPTHDVTLAFLEAVTDPAHGKVFFHCYHGVDRTGTMAACLRIARDGWTVEEALAEMRAFKVHESGQRSKLAYVADFAAYWQTMADAERRRVLHLPDLEPEAPPPPSGTLERLGRWVGSVLGRFLPRKA